MLLPSEKVLTRISWYSLCRRFCVKPNTNPSSSSLDEYDPQRDDKLTKISTRDRKCLKISILGTPNAGKSTLVNQLVKRAVCATSSKVHTTQVRAEGIYTEGNTQLVFIDTPGLVSEKEQRKYNLHDSFQNDPRYATNRADIIGIVQDASNKYTRNNIDRSVLNVIEHKATDVPKILILNKVDAIKKKHVLLGVVREINKNTPLLAFNDVFMVSALNGDGIEDLKNYLLDLAKPQDWYYEDGVYTDQVPEDIVLRIVRAELLNDLPNEVPYKMQVELEDFQYCPDGSISTVVLISCPTKHIHKLILGYKGVRIRNIALACEEQLRRAFYSPVLVKLDVICVKK